MIVFSFKHLIMKLSTCFLLFSIFLSAASCQTVATTTSERTVGGPCDCCEAWKDDIPPKLNWHTTLTTPGEPGEPLEVSGTIFHQDGKTPAKGVILYLYQTNEKGVYADGSTTSECATRNGNLRGWIKTGADGKYHFKTILPGHYPGTDFERHIHPIIKEPGVQEYWIDEYSFDNDPMLTAEKRAHFKDRGGSGIMPISKNKNGIWTGKRDIVLGENIPGY